MKRCILFLFFSLITMCGFTQGMEDMWDSSTAGKAHLNIQWFKEAKFGLFIHWGL